LEAEGEHAEGEHAPPTRSRALFQAEAAPPKQAFAVAIADTPDDVAQRQPNKHAHGDADARRRYHATPRRSRFHSRVNAGIAPFEFGRADNYSRENNRRLTVSTTQCSGIRPMLVYITSGC